jgi:polyisoprenoid-binding protein YceI
MTTAILGTTWQIDAAHSEVGFEVKHLMMSKVRGRFGSVSGTITLDAEEFARSQTEIDIEVSSIDTGHGQRDEHLRSADFFDVESFPRMAFRSTRIEPGHGGFRLIGELKIRGVTREVVLEVVEEGHRTDPWGVERLAFSGSTLIDRRDYGLTWNQALEAGGVLVGNQIRIVLEVQAMRAG